MIFLLFATACTGNKTGNPEVAIDTATLFDPKPEPEEEGAAEMNLFTNAVAVMGNEGFTVHVNDKMYVCKDLEELEDSLGNDAGEIAHNKFYIWIDSSTSFKSIVSVIDVLRKVKIENYKVIHLPDFTPPEPVQITMPPSVSTIVEDTSSFLIHILDKSIEVTLSNNVTMVKNSIGLDTFISGHKESINSKRILIKASGGLPYKKFEPIVNVLKKHGIFKYNLATE
jgi:biopolymer transport protein ExbD